MSIEEFKLFEDLEYEKPDDVPPCKGYWHNSPYYGEEFDCEYDVFWGCEECLVNWSIGGDKDPRTPEKYLDMD